MPFKPEDSRPPAVGEGAIDPLGLTRVTFSKGEHTFEFRCERGQEAALARAVLEMSGRPGNPLEPGDALALCRRIESLAPPGCGADAANQARKAA